MIELRKSKHSKTMFFVIDGKIEDYIHYENLEDLMDYLRKYYLEELLEVDKNDM